MKRKMAKMISLGGFVLAVVLGTAWQVQAQDAIEPYPKMALLSQ